MKKLGYVLWWDKEKGEGEILDAESQKSFYVHHSAIKVRDAGGL